MAGTTIPLFSFGGVPVSLGEAVDLAGWIGTVAAGLFAALQFRQSVRTKRTEWLYALYKDFYEGSTYKRIREALDDPKEPEFERLKQAIETDAAGAELSDFTDYLNFFEFVFAMCELKRFRTREIASLFNYPVQVLADLDFVYAHVTREGYSYEALARALKRRRRRRSS